MANEAKMTFAAATTVISQTATVADDEVVGGDTELDNSTNLYPLATAVIDIQDTFGGTPSGAINLYMVRGDVDSTSDGTALGYAALDTSDNQTSAEYAEYLGSWYPNVDEAYRDTITISLTGVKKAKFYIQNKTGETLVYSSNAITVKVTPFSFVPGT